MKSFLTQFRLALSFITILPAGSFSERIADEVLGRAQAWFPLIGLLLGLLLLAALLVGRLFFPPGVCAVLVLLSHFLLTGGFHLDGLADTADGLMCGHRETDRVFAIMKDSYLGSMGAVTLILLLLLKFSALSALLSRYPLVVVVFPVLGRYAVVQLTYSSIYARPGGGLGALFTDNCGRRELSLALLSGLIVAFAGAGPAGFAALCAVVFYTFLVAIYARNRFGGVTGDILGFVCESGEALTLLVLVAALR
jgi:adenosylcobinamide-GDP ribazoletransferase